MKEAATEISPTGTKLKKDILDLSAKTNYEGGRYLWQLATVFVTAVAAGSGAFRLLPLSNIGAELMLLGLAWPIKNIISASREFNRAIDSKLGIVDQDYALGYRASQFVYQGDSIERHGISLKKGDNFMYVELPYLQNPDLKSDIHRYALSRIKKSMANQTISAVALPYETPGLFPRENNVMPLESKLFKGKGIESRYQYSILVTPQEFEALASFPNEEFTKVVEALDDRTVIELYAQARKENEDLEKLKRIEGLLLKRVDQILVQEVIGKMNGPEIQFRRDVSQMYPERTTVYPMSILRKTEDGYFFVKIQIPTGEIRSIPLDHLLKTADIPIESVINSTNIHKRAQLSYLVWDFIREFSLKELASKQILSRGEILQKAKELGLDLPIYGFEQYSERWPFDNRNYLLPKRAIPPLLTTLALYAAGSFLSSAENIDYLKQLPAQVEKVSQQTSGKESAVLPDRLSPAGLEWKIEGTVDPNGYYTTDTSHQFAKGGWEVNQQVEKQIKLPKTFAGDKYIRLQRVQELNPLNRGKIKIPIKTGTELAALDITNYLGETVDFTLNQITDGTIEAVLPNNLISSSPWVNIDARLTPSIKPAIFASQKMDAIDTNKLSPEAKNQIEKAKSAAISFDQFTEYTASIISNSHQYSFNPAGKEKVNKAQTPEEYINAIVEIAGCICASCNTAAVPATTVYEGEGFANIAFGFIAIDGHTAGSQNGFLRTEARHAFGITNSGKIFDATPTSIANEPMTQQYMNMLHGSGIGDTAEVRWEKNKQEIQAEAEKKGKIWDGLKIMGAIAAAGATAFALRQASRFIKRVSGNTNPVEIADKAVGLGLNKEDKTRAINFLTWVSFGKRPEKTNLNQDLNLGNETNWLKYLRDNVSYEKLLSYIKSPKTYERKYGLSPVESTKLRILARHLLGT